MNGRNPFVVRATWQDEQTGHTHEATSDYLWRAPDPAMLHQKVRVLVDPNNPQRSMIDLTQD